MPADSAPLQTADAAADADTDRRLELYIRDSYPAAVSETIHTIRERCTRLDTQNVVDDCRIDHWPPCTPASTTDLAAEQASRHDRVTLLQAWAADNDYSLEPAFDTHTVTSSLLDRELSYEHISVPLLTLVLYDDDEVCGVFPCTSEHRTYTVDDGITALETKGADAFPDVLDEPAAPASNGQSQ